MHKFFFMYLFYILPEAVLIQFVSPDDEHCVLETRRELQIEIDT
jgi:hypothetical protein